VRSVARARGLRKLLSDVCRLATASFTYLHTLVRCLTDIARDLRHLMAVCSREWIPAIGAEQESDEAHVVCLLV